jgi:hypothetical protein
MGGDQASQNAQGGDPQWDTLIQQQHEEEEEDQNNAAWPASNPQPQSQPQFQQPLQPQPPQQEEEQHQPMPREFVLIGWLEKKEFIIGPVTTSHREQPRRWAEGFILLKWVRDTPALSIAQGENLSLVLAQEPDKQLEWVNTFITEM